MERLGGDKEWEFDWGRKVFEENVRCVVGENIVED